MVESGMDFRQLIQRIDAFIRKFYKNQMVKGSIYSAAITLAGFIIVVLMEHFGRFDVSMRTILFWGFVICSLSVFIRLVLLPASRMYRLGKVISHEQAAIIIGKYFPGISDKLLNTLQLQGQVASDADTDLIQASIRQKLAEMKPVPFVNAVDLGENRKYIKWVLPPLALIMIILFAAPSVLTKSTQRLIRYSEHIAEEAPFTMSLTNAQLVVEENSDFAVEVAVSGETTPEKIYMLINDQPYLMERISPVLFSYTLRKVRENQTFHFRANGFSSGDYTLQVLPLPRLVDFDVELNYPAYLGLSDETRSNSGDLIVPAGTKISWSFSSINTQSVQFISELGNVLLDASSGKCTHEAVAASSVHYTLCGSNEFVACKDSTTYRVEVIPDLHPQITGVASRDSLSHQIMYCKGTIRDDYGFSALNLKYQITGAGGQGTWTTIDLNAAKGVNYEDFFYVWDLSSISLSPGDKLNYVFEVWDNDGFHGPKSSSTQVMEFHMPTEDQLEEMIAQKNEDIKDLLEESKKDAEDLQRKLDAMRKQLLDKNQLNGQDQQKLEELMRQQEELQRQVEEIRRNNENKQKQDNEIHQNSEEIQKKQEQLDKLLNEIMNPELEQLLNELKRLMEELNKDEIQKELEKMDMSNEDIEKELDRALEQFKQLEWEQKMEKTIDKLEKLADEQEKLANEAEQKETNSSDLKEKQDSLNKEFEELSKELDELKKMNEELETPNPMSPTENQENEIKEEQKSSSESLSKNKKSGASKSQKKAASKMKEIAEQMTLEMDSGAQEQQEEDMGDLRSILENIITLSFDQEKLMADFGRTDAGDPKYNKLGQQQRKLKDDASMVEDSLFALSKRVPQISAAVNREINLINESMSSALSMIPDRRTGEIAASQQLVMTSFNNLALMLDEALQQMQEQQQQSQCNKPGSGKCNKPGGTGSKPKPSAGQLKQMQQNLAKQLEQMKKEGKNKGDNKGKGNESSKQLAEMAAKQAAIRKAVEEKASELNQDGSGNGNELKQIAKEMEQLQKDIVNNQISEETLRRQKDIEIRLLKAEEAERTRDRENERKSNEGKEMQRNAPPELQEFMKQRDQQTELLKTVPPHLKKFYKEKVNSYFYKLATP
jgi:hypothetical protein